MTMHPYQPQSGSVLFYILIAVALIGSLTFIISDGSRGGAEHITEEQAKIAAQEILEYGQTTGGAVQRLRLRGVSDTNISFENSGDATYANALCEDNSCKVFDPAGGNIIYRTVDEKWLDSAYSAFTGYGQWYFTGNLSVHQVGTTEPDLIMFLRYIKPDICKKINAVLSLPEATVTDSYSGTVGPFNGETADYTAAATPLIGDTATDYAGQTSFCFKSADDQYMFAHVLLAR